MAAAAATSNGPAAERVGRRDGELQCGSECDCASKQKLKWGERRKKKKLLNWLYVHKTKKEEEEKEKKMSTRYHRLLLHTAAAVAAAAAGSNPIFQQLFFLTRVRLSLKQSVRQSGSHCTFSANFGENATWRESLLISDGFLHAAPSGGKQGHIFLIKIVVSSLSADYKSVENLPHW